MVLLCLSITMEGGILLTIFHVIIVIVIVVYDLWFILHVHCMKNDFTVQRIRGIYDLLQTSINRWCVEKGEVKERDRSREREREVQTACCKQEIDWVNPDGTFRRGVRNINNMDGSALQRLLCPVSADSFSLIGCLITVPLELSTFLIHIYCFSTLILNDSVSYICLNMYFLSRVNERETYFPCSSLPFSSLVFSFLTSLFYTHFFIDHYQPLSSVQKCVHQVREKMIMIKTSWTQLKRFTSSIKLRLLQWLKSCSYAWTVKQRVFIAYAIQVVLTTFLCFSLWKCVRKARFAITVVFSDT